VHSKSVRVEDEGYFTVITCKGTPDCFRTAAADIWRVIKQPKLFVLHRECRFYSSFKGVYYLHPNRDKAGWGADHIIAEKIGRQTRLSKEGSKSAENHILSFLKEQGSPPPGRPVFFCPWPGPTPKKQYTHTHTPLYRHSFQSNIVVR